MASGSDMKPAYLVAGSDEGKIDAVLARLRARAEREGGPGALESFGPADGQGPPDVAGLVAAIPAMSLIASRRYLLAERIERLDPAAIVAIAQALTGLPPELTVVLVERDAGVSRKRSKARAAASAELAKAVKAAGGEVLAYQAPTAKELPARLVADARRLGFRLEPAAAAALVERMGESTMRLANELERLALWAGADGEVTVEDLEAMVADTSEEVAWTLSDAVVARDPAAAVAAAERLVAQGESPTPLVYQAARRLREAHRALLMVEEGRSEKEVATGLRMHPYAAKMLLRRLRGATPEELRAATRAIAELEWWTRGGSEYPDDVALTLAVRSAAGAGSAAR